MSQRSTAQHCQTDTPFVQHAKVALLGISPCQCPIVKRSGDAYFCSYALLVVLSTVPPPPFTIIQWDLSLPTAWENFDRQRWSTIPQQILFSFSKNCFIWEKTKKCGGGFGWDVTTCDFRSRSALPSQVQIRPAALFFQKKKIEKRKKNAGGWQVLRTS